MLEYARVYLCLNSQFYLHDGKLLWLGSLLYIIVRMQVVSWRKCHQYLRAEWLRVQAPKYLVFLCRERFSISGYMRNNRSQQWSETERSASCLKPVSSFFDLMVFPPSAPPSFNLNQMD